MALDNAQFISELSITDPPGTDAVAEGDDHIRTVKRATQQSFPNVDAAVPQTAAQMGQMAIKNETNAFTQQNQFAAITTFNDTGVFNVPSQHQEAVQIRPPLFTESVADIRYQTNAATPIIRWILRMEDTAFVGDENDFKIQLRDAAGAFVADSIHIKATNGFIDFNTAAAAYFGQALRLETAPVADPAVQTGMLFIGGSGTLRWALARQSDNVTGDLVINRFDGGGALQNTIMRFGNNGVVTIGSATLTQTIEAGGAQLSWNFANDAGIARWGFLYSSTTGDLTLHPRSATGSLESAILRLDGAGRLFMDRLPTGPTANSKEIYAKQSQTFAGTELVLGQTP